MGGWVDGWMGGWVDGWMGGWIVTPIPNHYSLFPIPYPLIQLSLLGRCGFLQAEAVEKFVNFNR
jgi:hypothetical protein